MSDQLLGAIITAVLVVLATPFHVVKQVVRMTVTGGHILNDDGVKVARFGGYEVDDTPFERTALRGWQWAICGALTITALYAGAGV